MIELRVRSVGPWPMNSYALVCPTTRQSLLIDPGADPDALEAMLASTTPIGILLTHTHADHLGALDTMRSRLQVPLFAHPGPHIGDKQLATDRTLADGDMLPLGDHQLRAYHTPGHTADMVCLSVEGEAKVIVGDTIFAGGPGRTWSSGDFQTTLQTLRNVVLAWSDDTICYPGHGDSFRLGDLRPAITAFVARDHGAFFGNATWDM